MRVLIADDHEMLRDVLRACLEADGRIQVTVAPDIDGAIEEIVRDGPYDVTLLDINMPGMDGLHGLSRVLEQPAAGRVALMSGIAPRAILQRAESLGSSGFISKTLAAEELVAAVRTLAGDGQDAPSSVSAMPLPDAPVRAAPELMARERQILDALCEGASDEAIAAMLGLREPTVRLHVRQIGSKLGARDRADIVERARDAGMIRVN